MWCSVTGVSAPAVAAAAVWREKQGIGSLSIDRRLIDYVDSYIGQSENLTSLILFLLKRKSVLPVSISVKT